MFVVISTIDVFFAANNQILWIFQRKMCAHGISWRRNEFRRVVYFSVSLGLHSKIISSNCKSDSIFCSSIFKPTISRENVPFPFTSFLAFSFFILKLQILLKAKVVFSNERGNNADRLQKEEASETSRLQRTFEME